MGGTKVKLDEQAQKTLQALEATFGRGRVVHVTNGRIGQKWQVARSAKDQFYLQRLTTLPPRLREDSSVLPEELKRKGVRLFWCRGNLFREVYLTIETDRGGLLYFELDRHSAHGQTAKAWLVGHKNYDVEEDLQESYRGEFPINPS